MRQSLQQYIDFFNLYIIESKAWGGILISGLGIMLLIGAFKDWNWLFGEVSGATYDLRKLDGIINMFGRKTGRVVTGIAGFILIPIGIGWFVLCISKQNSI